MEEVSRRSSSRAHPIGNNSNIGPAENGSNSEPKFENKRNENSTLLIQLPILRATSANNSTPAGEKPICRICFRGSSDEPLHSPCKCKGTVGYVHRHCLERWLGTRECEICELCHHQFVTSKTHKSFWDWCRHPDSKEDRRNFIGDFLCFTILTPLGMASFWLCAQGAMYYQHLRNATWETAALISLAAFLVIAYTTWIILSIRYHILVWRRWRQHNFNVSVTLESDNPLTVDYYRDYERSGNADHSAESVSSLVQMSESSSFPYVFHYKRNSSSMHLLINDQCSRHA